MSPTDHDRAQEAVEAVLRLFYEAIGTPPPAPGIERLAFLAVDGAYGSLREQWQQERDEAKELLQGLLAECFRLSGADPDGASNAMLAASAVQEVRRMRAEQDAAREVILAMEEFARGEKPASQGAALAIVTAYEEATRDL